MPGKPGRARAPFQLLHDGGVVRLPARLNVRSDELYNFLLGQLPPSGSRDLPESLAGYHAQQETMFGPERVFSYRARPQRGGGRAKGGVAAGVATILAGFAWLVAGVLLGHEGGPWVALGILVAFFGAIFTLIQSFESPGPRIANWQASGLVISPVGLALVQGEMRGELPWFELRDIRFRRKPGFFEMQFAGSPRGGIHLIVAGATITIADIYDRPLALIHERLLAYWRRGAGARE
jgi:hypothetical protein